MAEQNCPTCGHEVRVVSDGEGTSHYEPLSDDEVGRRRVGEAETGLRRTVQAAATRDGVSARLKTELNGTLDYRLRLSRAAIMSMHRVRQEQLLEGLRLISEGLKPTEGTE